MTDTVQFWKINQPNTELTWGRELNADIIVKTLQQKGLLWQGMRLCEIGFGYNRLLRSVLKAGIDLQYTGIDINEVRIKNALLEFPKFPFYCTDITSSSLPEEASKQDVIISMTVFNHFYPDFGIALKNLKASIPKGTKIAFDIPLSHYFRHYRQYELRDGYFLRIYKVPEIEDIVALEGFRIIDCFHLVHNLDMIGTTCPPPIIREMFVLQ
jgi:2-polyprenyl-3-methyl-5-hydroxy-6-metoxy-1,4-benzoquinol methylase